MTYEEVWKGFATLPPQEQGRFLDAARQMVKMTTTNLRSGAKVCFRNNKTGATITGEFIRMKTKFAEVRVLQDSVGIDRPTAVFWNVPPEMLRLVSDAG